MTRHKAMTLVDVVNGAIGPFEDYCGGYGNPGASGLGYVSVLKMSTGMVAKQMNSVIEGIVSHDRAQKNDAYAGQVNMITASSFTGINGAVWGYDLARHDGLRDGTIRPIMQRKRHDGVNVPIFPVAPLLAAGEQLFGSQGARRYPLLPGAHVSSAAKDITVCGPTSVWSAMALAIAHDREHDSSLFVEDVGEDALGVTTEQRAATLETRMENIVDSVMLGGADQDIKYKEIFVGYKSEWIPAGYVGCALTCAPYVVLARNAVPEPPSRLLSMSLSEWDEQHGF